VLKEVADAGDLVGFMTGADGGPESDSGGLEMGHGDGEDAEAGRKSGFSTVHAS